MVYLDVLKFRYFLAVVHEMNITRAAKKMYISQQSLSEHIKKLEYEYKVKLFERTPYLRLTYAGEAMVDLAERALNLQTIIEDKMSEISGHYFDTLSVGIRPSHSRILIPKILPIFNEKYPNIKLKFSIFPSKELVQLLLNGQLDLGVVSPRYALSNNFISLLIYSDQYCMVIPENILNYYFDMSLEEFQKGQEINLNYLVDIPFLMTKPGGATRELADSFLLEKGINRPNIIIETTGHDFDMNFMLCTEGLGITFTYELFYKYFIKNNPQKYKLLKVPIDISNRNADMIICHHRNRTLNFVANEFIRLTKEVALEL